jgi:hypothetical protein
MEQRLVLFENLEADPAIEARYAEVMDELMGSE